MEGGTSDALTIIKQALSSKGHSTMCILSTYFNKLESIHGNRKLPKHEFKEGIKAIGITLTKDQLRSVVNALDIHKDGYISFDKFLIEIRGKPNCERQSIIERAFIKLDLEKIGCIACDKLKGEYKCNSDILAGKIASLEVFSDFLKCVGDKNGNDKITMIDWSDYYAAVSASVDNDQHFIELVTQCWKIDEHPIRSLIDQYNEDEVIVPDPKMFEQKMHTLLLDGASNVDIITDFDFTLTRKMLNSNGADSAFGVCAKSRYVPLHLSKRYKELYEYYYPIEKDENISFEKKDHAMNEWWDKSLEVITLCKFTLQQLIDSIYESYLRFRHGLDLLYRAVSKFNIRMYVMSAGIYQVISQSIKLALSLDDEQLKGISIIANDWEDKGEIRTFKKPYTYTTNKSQKLTKANYPTLKKNAILMGDMMEDLLMSKNTEHKCVLTIGYYNVDQSTTLDKYKTGFDLIIKGQGSLIHITRILNYLYGCKDFDSEYSSYPSSAVLFNMLK